MRKNPHCSIYELQRYSPSSANTGWVEYQICEMSRIWVPFFVVTGLDSFSKTGCSQDLRITGLGSDSG